MHKKEAIKECLNRCQQYDNDHWTLCWEKGKGFYPVDPWVHNYSIWPCHSDHAICDIHKSGRMINPRKPEYIKQFSLHDHQNQKGQAHNFEGWVGPDWIRSYGR